MRYTHTKDPNELASRNGALRLHLRLHHLLDGGPQSLLAITPTPIPKEPGMSANGITEHHRHDDQGRPAGGETTSVGLNILWQTGPLAIDGRRLPPNGAFVEDVIEAALGRLRFYQGSQFVCRENALAITKLEEALHWLQHRTADREARGVEGTHAL